MTDTVTEKFYTLRLLRQGISNLCQHHLAALSLFHPTADLTKIAREKTEIAAFSRMLPTDADKHQIISDSRISIASTVTCIKSLLSCPQFRPEKNVSYEGTINRLQAQLSDKNLTTGGLKHGNPFTMGLLLFVLKLTNAIDKGDPLVQAALEHGKNAVSKGGASIGTFPPNGYLTYWILRSLEEWEGTLAVVACGHEQPLQEEPGAVDFR